MKNDESDSSHPTWWSTCYGIPRDESSTPPRVIIEMFSEQYRTWMNHKLWYQNRVHGSKIPRTRDASWASHHDGNSPQPYPPHTKVITAVQVTLPHTAFIHLRTHDPVKSYCPWQSTGMESCTLVLQLLGKVLFTKELLLSKDTGCLPKVDVIQIYHITIKNSICHMWQRSRLLKWIIDGNELKK